MSETTCTNLGYDAARRRLLISLAVFGTSTAGTLSHAFAQIPAKRRFIDVQGRLSSRTR
jgi:hypothetical protein